MTIRHHLITAVIMAGFIAAPLAGFTIGYWVLR